jgi:hypothetical protein
MSPKRKSHYHKGLYRSSKTGLSYNFRSGWEEAYMKYLDSNAAVVSWSYEQIQIAYLSNKKIKKYRKYYPDFQVLYDDESIKIIEIKPKKRLKQAAVQKKISAAEEWCSVNGFIFQIITENELKELGIL